MVWGPAFVSSEFTSTDWRLLAGNIHEFSEETQGKTRSVCKWILGEHFSATDCVEMLRDTPAPHPLASVFHADSAWAAVECAPVTHHGKLADNTGLTFFLSFSLLYSCVLGLPSNKLLVLRSLSGSSPWDTFTALAHWQSTLAGAHWRCPSESAGFRHAPACFQAGF